MFDDHCCQLTGGGTYVKATQPSRGLVLKLDQVDHTASKVAAYGVGYGVEADYMGDTQPLSNGNVFVGFGSQPYLDEFTSSGEPVLEGKLPGSNLSYRTTLEQWVGLPLSSPAAAARQVNAATTVYASWNGATRVASWRVLAGHTENQLSTIATAARSGFETAIAVPGNYQNFKVQALDSNGRVIGTSRPFKSGT